MSFYSDKLRGKYDPSIRELKQSVISRIQQARRDGVTVSEIADACDDSINLTVIYDMLDAQLFSKEAWESVDEALKSIGF